MRIFFEKVIFLLGQIWEALGDLVSGKPHPPVMIPLKLFNRYTLNGRILPLWLYFNSTTTPLQPPVYTTEGVDAYLRDIKAKKTFYYSDNDTWLYQALETYGVKGQNVAIIGSTTPLYESICLNYGARPFTIDYNKILTTDNRLTAMTVDEYRKNPIVFDAAVSISSFEHDGLGRYGDPLNPEGDFEAMQATQHMIKPGGILYLSVPVGRDRLWWNAHRIYGRIRLPLLLREWELLGSFGFNETLFKRRGWVQPVFVLKNKTAPSSLPAA